MITYLCTKGTGGLAEDHHLVVGDIVTDGLLQTPRAGGGGHLSSSACAPIRVDSFNLDLFYKFNNITFTVSSMFSLKSKF